MRNTIKKICLYLLVASLTWLPVQVAFAATFTLPAGMALNNIDEGSVKPVSVVKHDMHLQQESTPCHTAEHKKNCCSEAGACSQMGHDCNHCVSFVAITAATAQLISCRLYSLQNSYIRRLTSVTSLSAYRPPC